MPEEPVQGARRQLKSREKPWARKLAAWVGRIGTSPNVISVLSIVFSLGAAICMVKVSDYPCKACASWIWGFAAVFIQLRLLCNLLDGMVAIEGGKKSVLGGLYNEVPDRIADAILFVAAGYCSDWVVKIFDEIPVGWVAAVLSVITAYIRVLGGTLTGTQSFIGPMAKQHRMAVLTLACLGSIVELWMRPEAKFAELVMRYALTIICVGCLITCWRRLCLIAQQLREKAAA